MAAQEIVTPTPFMKSLSAADYDALKKDVEQRVAKGKKGFEELARIIRASRNVDLINTFASDNNSLKVRISLFNNIKNGFADLPTLKVNDDLKQKIINVYNLYFKDLEEAGKGNIKYNVTTNDGDKIILIYDYSALLNPQAYGSIYKALQTKDVYAAKAVSDYTFRHLLGREDVLTDSAQRFLIAAAGDLGPDTFAFLINDLVEKTPAGNLGALRAILEKLNNYNAGAEEFLQNPNTDVSEDASVTFLENQFNDFLLQYNIGFELNTYLRAKVGRSDLVNSEKGNFLKKSFYTAITPSEQLKDIANNKYVVNIWNKIKESRTTRISSICRFY
jgi:hypothetical protein